MSTPSTEPANAAATAAGVATQLMGAVTTMKDKFEAVGGNEMLSKVSSTIPQGAKDYIGNASKSLFKREHLRSFTVFFGIGEERSFYLERSPSLLMARLQHNSTFFYLNYMLVFAVLFVLTTITSMQTMIGIVFLAAAWLVIIRASADGLLKIGPLSISQKHASIGMGVISAMVLFYLLSHIFWWTLGSGGFLVGMHGFLRDASMHQDSEDRVEMSGDLTLEGENASFLNPVEGEPVVVVTGV